MRRLAPRPNLRVAFVLSALAVAACSETVLGESGDAGAPAVVAHDADADLGDASSSPADAGAEPARVARKVDSAGGDVKVPSGSGVEIPEGALASDVTVSVEEDPSAPPPTTDGASVGTPVTFGPEGQTFAVPITVTLAVDVTRLPAGKTLADVVVLTAPRGSTSFVALTTSARDGGLVAAQTSHFSTFVPFVIEADADAPSDAGPTDPTDGAVPEDGGEAEADAGDDAGYYGNVGYGEPGWSGFNPTATGPGETLRDGMGNVGVMLAAGRVFYTEPSGGGFRLRGVPFFDPAEAETYAEFSGYRGPSNVVADSQGRVYWVDAEAYPPHDSRLLRKPANQPSAAAETLPVTDANNAWLRIEADVLYFDGEDGRLHSYDLATSTEKAYGTHRFYNYQYVRFAGGQPYWFEDEAPGPALYTYNGESVAVGLGFGLDDEMDLPYWGIAGNRLYYPHTDHQIGSGYDFRSRDLGAPNAPAVTVTTSNLPQGTFVDEQVFFHGSNAYVVAKSNDGAPNRFARVDLTTGTFTTLAAIPNAMYLIDDAPGYVYFREYYQGLAKTRVARMAAP